MAATPVLTTAQAKAWLRVDISDDDTLIDNLVTASTEFAEDFTRRRFINKTETEKFTVFTDPLILPFSPLSSVTSITYLDADGVEQTLATSVYDVHTNPEPGQVRLAFGQAWPSVRGDFEGITVTYVAGYSATSASVPQSAATGIKQILHDSYEFRGNQTDAKITVNPAALRLLWPLRVLGATT